MTQPKLNSNSLPEAFLRLNAINGDHLWLSASANITDVNDETLALFIETLMNQPCNVKNRKAQMALGALLLGMWHHKRTSIIASLDRLQQYFDVNHPGLEINLSANSSALWRGLSAVIDDDLKIGSIHKGCKRTKRPSMITFTADFIRDAIQIDHESQADECAMFRQRRDDQFERRQTRAASDVRLNSSTAEAAYREWLNTKDFPVGFGTWLGAEPSELPDEQVFSTLLKYFASKQSAKGV
jgi:hypothetical protein